MSKVFERLKKAWNQHWFRERRAQYLAVQRILFFGFLSFYTFSYSGPYYWSWALLPEQFWMPVGPFAVFDSPPLSAELLKMLEVSWPWILLLCGVGLLTRLMTILAFVFHFLFVGISLCYGEGSHDQLITVAFLLVFCVSNCGDAYSIDRFFWKKRGKEWSSNYHWPIQLQRWFFCSYFVGAGLSKLQVGGFGWILDDSLAHHMIFSHYRSSMSPLATDLGIGIWIASIPLLSRFLAGATVFLEFFSPLALFVSPFWRRTFMLAHLLMIVGFYFVATKGFMNMVGLYFCWFAGCLSVAFSYFETEFIGRMSQILYRGGQ